MLRAIIARNSGIPRTPQFQSLIASHENSSSKGGFCKQRINGKFTLKLYLDKTNISKYFVSPQMNGVEAVADDIWQNYNPFSYYLATVRLQ